MNILGVHFDDKLADTNNVEVEGMECAEQTIQLYLGLRIVTLLLVPGNGTEMRRAASTVGAFLRQDPANSVPR